MRAACVIHTFGEPGRCYRSTDIYLTSPAGRRKWWTIDRRIADIDLTNRATTDRVYGAQDAPRTLNPVFTEYDAVATAWDELRDSSPNLDVRRRVADHFSDHAPTTLEVGCGTGALLDLGVTKPWRYTGIDPSQWMLNRLVLKHPWVHRVYPRRLEQVRGVEERYELVVAMDAPGVDVGRLQGLASELLVVTGSGDTEATNSLSS